MWESPILIYQTAMNGITTEIDGQIIAEIKTQVGIDINKEELIKAINYDRDSYNKGYNDGLNADRWIPVERELPKENETVMASCGQCVFPEARYSKKYGWEGLADSLGDYWETIYDVEAWQPLPKPYGAEREEEDE